MKTLKQTAIAVVFVALLSVCHLGAQNGSAMGGPIVNPDGSCCAAPIYTTVDCSQVCGPGCPTGNSGGGEGISNLISWLLMYVPSLVY